MSNTKKRSQGEIESHYDDIVVNDIIPRLTKGEINGSEFIEAIAALKKKKDNDLLVEAREIPPLKAPKAVGLGAGVCGGVQRQGVN